MEPRYSTGIKETALARMTRVRNVSLQTQCHKTHLHGGTCAGGEILKYSVAPWRCLHAGNPASTVL
jgi:hypothetical protein